MSGAISTGVTKWEHQVVVLGLLKTTGEQAAALNALGAQGWEVLTVMAPNAWTLLRRPLAASP